MEIGIFKRRSKSWTKKGDTKSDVPVADRSYKRTGSDIIAVSFGIRTLKNSATPTKRKISDDILIPCSDGNEFVNRNVFVEKAISNGDFVQNEANTSEDFGHEKASNSKHFDSEIVNEGIDKEKTGSLRHFDHGKTNCHRDFNPVKTDSSKDYEKTSSHLDSSQEKENNSVDFDQESVFQKCMDWKRRNALAGYNWDQSCDDSNSYLKLQTVEPEKDILSDEDRKYVSEAVAFFICHSQKGIVSLCVNLANLLKEKDILKQDLSSVRGEQPTDKNFSTQTPVPKVLAYEDSIAVQGHTKRKIINGCLCRFCETVAGDSLLNSVNPPLKHDKKVIIKGEILGIVKYVGHIDDCGENSIHIGLQLDVPIGNTDGVIKGKKYFDCRKRYGLFVFLQDVLCLVS